MPSLGSGPLTAVPCAAGTGVSRYSYSVDRYRLSSYMPPIADRLADTAAWPWRNSIRYMVIWPRVMRPTIVVMAIQPYAAYSRSEEHTSELQSLMRISYAVFCLKKKNKEIKKQ